MDEGVADSQVERERRGPSSDVSPKLQRGDSEPEPGDGHGERVEVDAVDRVERRLYPGLGFQAWGVPVPLVEEPVEGAEQEVP